MSGAVADLSEKEVAVLRLILEGHDAKSSARALDLSVHTVNDRLRAARRKLGVTSSREAARLWREAQSASPQKPVHTGLGDAFAAADAAHPAMPPHRDGARGVRRIAALAGVVLMLTMILAAALASCALQTDPGSVPSADSAPSPAASAEHAAAVAAAQAFLRQIDQADWAGSFAATGHAFREQNTLEGWTEASKQVRGPLGAVLRRDANGARYLNAPPNGYLEVTFTADYAGKKAVREIVTLENEDGAWRVVGIMVD